MTLAALLAVAGAPSWRARFAGVERSDFAGSEAAKTDSVLIVGEKVVNAGQSPFHIAEWPQQGRADKT